MATIQHNGGKTQEGKEDPIIAFRCPPELKRQMKIRAAEEETTTQALCLRALQAYLASHSKLKSNSSSGQ